MLSSSDCDNIALDLTWGISEATLYRKLVVVSPVFFFFSPLNSFTLSNNFFFSSFGSDDQTDHKFYLSVSVQLNRHSSNKLTAGFSLVPKW